VSKQYKTDPAERRIQFYLPTAEMCDELRRRANELGYPSASAYVSAIMVSELSDGLADNIDESVTHKKSQLMTIDMITALIGTLKRGLACTFPIGMVL
jgi:hypothetical protein